MIPSEKIKEAILELAGLVYHIQKNEDLYPPEILKNIKNIQNILSFVSLFTQAGELPEKREIGSVYEEKKMGLDGKIITTRQHIHYDSEARAFNEAIDLCTPLYLKVKAELVEVQSAYRGLEKSSVIALDEKDKLIAELVEALERLCGFCGNETFDRAVKKGQQALLKAKGKE